MRTTHVSYWAKYGGGLAKASNILHAAVSETPAAAREGHGGSRLNLTQEDILHETQAVARRKRSALGPDAVSYEALGLFGETVAENMAWRWATSILFLVRMAGKRGREDISGPSTRAGTAENGDGLHDTQHVGTSWMDRSMRMHIVRRCSRYSSPSSGRNSPGVGRSIQYKDTWDALRSNLGCRRAFAIFHLFVGALSNIRWRGELLEEPIQFRPGVRQGGVEMPTM